MTTAQFDSCEKPSRSPWGVVQTAKELAPGIWSVSTAGHGGLKLSRQRNAAMPAYMRAEGGWYEEDCEWSKVAIAFPEPFKAAATSDGKTHYEYAVETLRHWFPDNYESFFNVKLQPGESRSRDESLWQTANAGRLVVAAAWGDWARFVPAGPGMVGVYARKLGDVDGGRWFLVPGVEYQARGPFGFVIDESRHIAIDEPSDAERNSRETV